jgi:hypothetical protein
MRNDGSLMHYNGSDISVIYPPAIITDLLVFPKDIYFICLDTNPLIIHGKLREE